MNQLFTLFLGVILLVISACTSGKEDVKKLSTEETHKVEERVRPAGSGGTSAAYLSYINTLEEPDTLISVKSSVAGMSQVHETFETEDGMMGMREQKNLVIHPNQTITFKQGGLHIMLMQLNTDLAEGDSVLIEMTFSQSGVVSKIVPVKNQ